MVFIISTTNFIQKRLLQDHNWLITSKVFFHHKHTISPDIPIAQ
jgi:hypothetical protein